MVLVRNKVLVNTLLECAVLAVVGMIQNQGGDEAYSGARTRLATWCWFGGQASLIAIVVEVIGSFVNIMWKFV